ncbi:MAG: hypothetical protein EA380_06775 [Phycisphaeraceae bacterium]|nr:MAG: hypothetical protein EA380_06775 [Phycisphaeraceae bacterium]
MGGLLERLGESVYPIGIDLDADGARLLQLARGRSGLRVVALAEISAVSLTKDGAEKTDTQSGEGSLDALLRAITRRVGNAGFRGRECVVSVDDRWLRTRSVRQTQMPDSECDKAVRLDGAQRLGFSPEESVEIGWLRAGEVAQGDDVRDELIYLGAQSERLNSVGMGLAMGGLRPIAMEPSFIAIARCMGRTLRRKQDEQVVRAVIEIGRTMTRVLITRGWRVGLYRTIEVGGEMMTRQAAERLGLEPETIEDLRRQRMYRTVGGNVEIDEKVDRAIFDAVRPLMGDLAHEITLCLRHYTVTFRGSRPMKCVIIGSESLEPRLEEVVGGAVHLPTVLGHPFKGVTLPENARQIDRCGVLAGWSVAGGLSLQPTDKRVSGRAKGLRRGVSECETELEVGQDAPQEVRREAA